MRIPKTIKVGPHTYTVKYEKGFLNNHNAYAQSRHSKTEIVLDPEVSQSQLEDTFIHEILHAIDQQISFTPKDEQETIVARLAPILLDVLKSNNLLK